MSNCDEDVQRIKKKLEKMMKTNDVDINTSIDMLNVLKNLPINLQVLQNTRIGVVVNNLRKASTSDELGTLAKNLLKSWKRLVSNNENGANKSSGPQSPNFDNDNSTSKSPPSTFQTTTTSNTPPTPQPQLQSQLSSQSNSNKDMSRQNSTESTSSLFSLNNNNNNQIQNNNNNNLHKTNSTSSLNNNSRSTNPLLNSDKKSSSFPQTPQSSSSSSSSSNKTTIISTSNYVKSVQYNDTKDAFRIKSRELLEQALQLIEPLDPNIPLYDAHSVACRCEDVIFDEFKNTDQKYRNRVRSRFSNLKDAKNPNLRKNVLMGLIKPEKLAIMSAEEMASDDLKQLRDKYTKEAINDHQMATAPVTKSSLLKCGKCKKSNCGYKEMQTRSADEPMTVFAFCNDCGHRWKQ